MNNHYPNQNPHVGATFYPGGVDDFYIPEVISPAPQRIMPEVPENMQHSLAHLEQQAQPPTQYNNQLPTQPENYNHHPQHVSTTQYRSNSYQYGQQGQGQHGGGGYNTGHQPYGGPPNFEPLEQPNFSPFPVLKDPPSNVPPSTEQKEASLETARLPVLGSNDPLNQLDWAQDALAYIEECIQNEQRTPGRSPAAIKLSRIQQLLKDDAMKVVQFLADQEHPRALVLKGIWLEFGKFDSALDKRQAWECYGAAVKSAAALNRNDPAKKWGGRAQYRIGMQFENSKEVDKALKHYNIGVEEGDSAASYRLGMMVLLGQHGKMQDFQRGLSLIFAAAQNADENAPQGAYVLGMLQAQELPQVSIPDMFLTKDINRARTNIERAAFLGFAKAQVRMGRAYELCELGCDFDPALSLHYNNLAARQGEVEAEMAISKWFLAGHEGIFEKDEEMAFTYAQRAAQDGLPTAQFAMGYFHEIGIYVPVNLPVAKEWYNKAAGNGNTDAVGRIDGLSRSKTLSRKDHERIAVSKIKESRLQSPTESAPAIPPLPAMIDMPDPARLSLSSPVYSGSDQYGQQRRPSGAPYPANTEFGSPRPGLASHSSNMSNPEVRPASAFGINPNLRPTSAATIAGTRPDQHVRPQLQEQGRPFSTYDNGPSAHGMGGRVVSSPLQQGYPGPGRGGRPPSQVGYPQPPPKVDIGFLAPIEPSGAQPPKGLQKVGSPHLGHQPQSTNSNLPPNSWHSRPPNNPYPQPHVTGNSQRPPQAESVAQKPLPQQSRPPPPAAALAPQKPAAQKPAAQKPAAQKPAPSFVKPVAATRPPGKGPKTFEEMGVPAGKGKDDCVIM